MGRGLLTWWKRRRRQHKLIIGLSAAAVVVAVVLLTTQVLFEPEEEARPTPGQTEPDEDTRNELAARFAPVLKLHGKELFVPIDRAAYVSAAALTRRERGVPTVVDESPDADDLPDSLGDCTLPVRCSLFLDIEGAEPPRSKAAAYDAIEQRALDGAKPTVYTHVTHYDEEDEYAVQYWFLYLFNDFLNKHEADWEQITIRLDASKQPIEAFYSSHEGGTRKLWGKVEQADGHPVVYVALGSHANYFTRGPGNTHAVTIGCRPVFRASKACVRKQTIRDRTNGKRVLQPAQYGLAELTGKIFAGGYGSGNFVAGKRTKDQVSDPRTRDPAWTDPLVRLRFATRIAKL
jgi:hypothetical protein